MISIFDLLSIGIGPSSSHTVGPMRAARCFVVSLKEAGALDKCARVSVALHGSLAWTGVGHGTPKAVLMGLSGEVPERVLPDEIPALMKKIKDDQALMLLGEHRVPFVEENDLLLDKKTLLPLHSNGMCFKAFDKTGKLLCEEIYYSIGGGFVITGEGKTSVQSKTVNVPMLFKTGAELFAFCEKKQCSIADVMMSNETAVRDQKEVEAKIQALWSVMDGCIQAGCAHEGILPGGLSVQRRAPLLFQKLKARMQDPTLGRVLGMDWVSCYAIAVNEENAAGGRVVTAPTNGAAGIIPAVLKYYLQTYEAPVEPSAKTYLLTAAAIGILFKEGASLSAAEVGCQGEVGVACSMAAAGLAALLGGNIKQIENAAEMGMEHHLGLTCDPVGGLVQIPCIERNAMGAVQAINSARLAVLETGDYSKISLDQVIQTMRETGKDMSTKYKETSQGGLALSMPEC